MSRPYIIGISGGSGSGKTTFIDELRKGFSQSEVCFLSQDNYYKRRELQETDMNNVRNFDLPTSLEKEVYVRDVKALIENQEVSRKEYTFNNALKEAGEIIYRPAPVLVLEGIFVYHYHEIADLMDLKIFIEVSEAIKLIRRIRRDQEERNYPLEDVIYRYENHVLPAYYKYILPYRSSCDVIINNNQHFRQSLDMLRTFIRSKVARSVV